MVNLYDITKGNYRVVRTVTYPEFPDSRVVFNVRVRAAGESEWVTDIAVNGRYDGPADVVSAKDYELTWTADGKQILETGAATLETASGRSVRQVWSSTFTPEAGFDRFPPNGETLSVSISPFQIEGNSMTYRWEGTVKARPK